MDNGKLLKYLVKKLARKAPACGITRECGLYWLPRDEVRSTDVFSLKMCEHHRRAEKHVPSVKIATIR